MKMCAFKFVGFNICESLNGAEACVSSITFLGQVLFEVRLILSDTVFKVRVLFICGLVSSASDAIHLSSAPWSSLLLDNMMDRRLGQ